MGIGKRLAASFGITIALFVSVGAMSLYSLARLTDADRWNVHTYKVISVAEEMQLALLNMQTTTRGYLLAGEERYVTPWTGSADGFEQAWSQAKELTVDNPSQQRRLDEAREKQMEYKAISSKLLDLRREVNAGRKPLPTLLNEFKLGHGANTITGAQKLLADFERAERDLLASRSAESERVRAMSSTTIIYGSLAALLLALALGYLITRSITRPIHDHLLVTLKRLAAGELNARVGLQRGDELGTIAGAIDTMSGNLELAAQRETAAREKELADTRALREQIDRLVAMTERAADGNLAPFAVATGDEATQRMSDGVQHMVSGLRALVINLQGSTVQIRSSLNQLSASVKETESMVTEQAATATQVAASTTEITQTARDLASTMKQISRSSEGAVGVADEGQHSLRRLDETLSNIVVASNAIASRLAVVGEKAGTISSVTSTITKVADQTNLLSLNAAIEAEKAGEAGQGFSVIATEIRRLADQTSVAAGDIEQIIKEMQNAVSASVMSMDKFNDEVQRNVGDVKTISQVLNQVIDHVKTAAPQFETLTQGMLAQSEGASQINQAIRQFTESIKLNTQTARNTDQATTALSVVADQLHAGIRRFKVD
ncbi:MAG: methyl-accepting chemotaxis protein [Pseudomonadota bacterium]